MSKRRVAVFVLAVALFGSRWGSAEVIGVPAGGDLQAALDRARPGDVIALQPGATFVGNFVLGVKGGAGFITLRSSAPDSRLPPQNARISPGWASMLARIQSPNAEPAIRTAPGAHHWRLLFLEFGPSAHGNGDIIRLGDGSAAQRTHESVPRELVVDRCYIHGDPQSAQKRGIALNSGSASIVNSWISDIKASGQDSQAIGGWNGPGPFVIANNYLEAAGENVMFGGADPWIDGLVPTGITIRNNWIRKQPSWRNGPWQVKNLLELKNARAVVVEGNLLENNWRAAQPGHAVLFTPRNQDGRAPWSTVQDVTFRRNVIRHVAAAFNILGRDDEHESQQARDITIRDNLVYDVDGAQWGGDGNFLLIGHGPERVVIEHNTVIQTGSIVLAYGGPRTAPSQVAGFVFRNNIVLHNEYGIKGDSHAIGAGTLTAYFPGAIVTRNVMAGGQASLYPDGNLFPSVSEFWAQFTNPSAGNFQLTSSSSLMKAASDGRAVGVDPVVARAVMAWAMTNVEIAKPRGAPPQKTRIGGR